MKTTCTTALAAVAFAIAPAVFALAPTGAGAQDVAEFYKGKTLSVYIGSDVGGGYNAYARTSYKHMAKYIPGQPNIVFLNMPGAGGRKATQYVATIAAKDGIAVGAVQPGALVEPILGDPKNVRYNPLEFGYIGSPESSDQLCLTRKDSPVKTFEDAFKHQVILGGDAKGSSMHDVSNLLKNVLGVKFRVIKGYKGSREAVLAMEKGEIDGICGYGWSPLMSQAPHLVRDKKVNLLVQFAVKGYAEPTEMGVPMIWKFVKTEEQRRMLELAAAPLVFGRPQFMPAEVPKDRLAALRHAFDQAMKDPAYIADAAKQKLGVTPASGEEIEEMIKRIYTSPKELQAKVRAALYDE